jgi:hypothetical protein
MSFALLTVASKHCFFNVVAQISKSWLPMQLINIRGAPELTEEGKRLMQQIGEYGQ